MGIMAQRLVRKVCPKCRARYEPDENVLKGIGLRPEIAKKANFMKGKGCSNCNTSGYRGRMGIYELMTMTTEIREMTVKGESTEAIRRLAAAGAVMLGKTSMHEHGSCARICVGATRQACADECWCARRRCSWSKAREAQTTRRTQSMARPLGRMVD